MSYLQAALEVCANDHFGTIAPSMSFPGKVSGFHHSEGGEIDHFRFTVE